MTRATRLSQHFTYREMVFSSTAVRQGIANIPNESHILSFTALCTNTLDPIRNALGDELHITSGYRAPALNAAVGGSPTSQHMRGEAADIDAKGLTPAQLFDFILQSSIPFDQIILEFNEWVHISFKRKGKQRRSVLYAFRNAAGRVVYTRTRPKGW